MCVLDIIGTRSIKKEEKTPKVNKQNQTKNIPPPGYYYYKYMVYMCVYRYCMYKYKPLSQDT